MAHILFYSIFFSFFLSSVVCSSLRFFYSISYWLTRANKHSNRYQNYTIAREIDFRQTNFSSFIDLFGCWENFYFFLFLLFFTMFAHLMIARVIYVQFPFHFFFFFHQNWRYVVKEKFFFPFFDSLQNRWCNL